MRFSLQVLLFSQLTLCNVLLAFIADKESVTVEVTEAAAQHMADLGYSSIECSPAKKHMYLQSCVLRNVCMDVKETPTDWPNDIQPLQLSPLKFYTKNPTSSNQSPSASTSRPTPVADMYERKFYYPGANENVGLNKSFNLDIVPFVRLQETRIESVISDHAASSHLYIEQPAALVDNLWGANYGHAYIDLLFSSHVGAEQLHMNIADFAFISSRTNTYKTYLQFASNLEIINATVLPDLPKYSGNTVCFSKLLIPGYHGYYSEAISEEMGLYKKSLRDIVYKSYPVTESNQGKIIMAFKQQTYAEHGGRVLLNFKRIEKVLSREYGKRFEMYEFGELTFQSQVDIMRSAAVFISPLGGCAASAYLLQDGAVFLQITGYNVVTRQAEPSFFREDVLYRTLPYIKLKYYYVKENETALDMTMKSERFKSIYPNEGLFSRVFGNYKLKPLRLIRATNAALSQSVFSKNYAERATEEELKTVSSFSVAIENKPVVNGMSWADILIYVVVRFVLSLCFSLVMFFVFFTRSSRKGQQKLSN